MRRFSRARCRGAAASHARAQIARTWDQIKRAGIDIRVQLDEKVSVAAGSLAMLQGIAVRGPAPRTSDARSARRGNNANDVHEARQMGGRWAAAPAGRARMMGGEVLLGYGPRGDGWRKLACVIATRSIPRQLQVVVEPVRRPGVAPAKHRPSQPQRQATGAGAEALGGPYQIWSQQPAVGSARPCDTDCA